MEPQGPARVERRLAAILAADVAGYSRLIEADEEGTLSRLKALRAELIDPKIAFHHGRIVKSTGDGLLGEFVSVVDALRCATEIQVALAEGNVALPPDRRIELRIGINVGDIVVEEGDIFGDGVNVAARLESLAEPGGICVSARVQEDAAGRLDLAFEDMGEQALKNIARPVRTYSVALATRSASVRPKSNPPPAEKPPIAVLPFANNQKGTGMVLAFGDHQLDIKRRELRRGTELIDLEPKVFDLLAFLVQNRDRVVSKDDLLQGVWGGRIVSESALTTRINAVRRALGDDGTAQRLVRTFTRKGVRFIGEVTEMSDPAVLAVTRATSIAPPLVAPRMSIVVLPFANLSNHPQHQYFADGITEDVTTDLSRIQNSFVISRNTAFTYRNKLVDTKQIGRELGVRYVLEGSVRRSGNKVRVNAQLIDAETDAHLWAEQFDGDITDLFALQNEITSRIAIALNVELSRREAASPTNNPDALDYILRGRAAYWKTGLQSRDLFAETLWLYERALALDPRSVEAQSQVANMLAIRAGNGWTESPASDFRRAEELVEQALAASPRDFLAHYAKGSVLRFQGRCDQAIPEYERALESNPNWLNSLDFLAACKMMTGSMETAISLEEQAIRLGSRDPYIGIFYSRIGQAHLLLAHTDEAIIWFEKAAGAIPGYGAPHAYLAATYALKGEAARASAELAEVRRLAADARYSSIARLKAAGTVGGPGYWGVPKVRALFEATYFTGLRKAGVPEE